MAKATLKTETHARLAALDPVTLAEIEQALLQGVPAREVAKVLHEEHGVLLDMKPDTLKKVLERHRAGPLKARLAAITTETRAPVLAKRINALAALEELIHVQEARMRKALDHEAKLPLPLKAAREEVKLLGSMLVKLGGMQFETGALVRAPRKIEGTVTDPETGDVKAFSWTETQEALFAELQQAAEAVSA